jgi:hypothetical protein
MFRFQFLNVAECFYITTIIFLKLSLGIFFLRLVQLPVQKRIIYVAMLANSVFGVAMLLFAIFQCGTNSNGFEFLMKRLGNKCASDATALGMTYTHAVITTTTDWTFLLLPIFILKDSLMEREEKRTLICILAFASMSGVASLVRFPYINHFSGPKVNFFSGAANIAIWSCLELGIGIICACLITLRPLLRRMKARYSDLSENENNPAVLPSAVKPRGTRGPSMYEVYDHKPGAIPIQFYIAESHKKAAQSSTAGPPQSMHNLSYKQPQVSKSHRQRGITFATQKSQDREPGFGLRLFGSSFGRSMSSSASTSSVEKSSGGEKFDSPTLPSMQPLEANSRQKSTRGYSKLDDRSSPQTSNSSLPLAKAPNNSPQAMLSPRTSAHTRGPAQSKYLPPQAARARAFSKPLPPTPTLSRNQSLHFIKSKTRNLFNPNGPQSKEPGLPLHVFDTVDYDDDESVARSSWLG